MSYYRNKGQKDANHNDIENALRSIGCDVCSTHTVGNDYPDLLAHLNGKAVFIEIKTEAGAFDISQLRFLATWRGYTAFVKNAEEAIKVMREPHLYALSERDKMRVLKIVLKYEQESKAKRPRIDVSTFNKQFEALKR
jgi:Holliday junction resolvase